MRTTLRGRDGDLPTSIRQSRRRPGVVRNPSHSRSLLNVSCLLQRFRSRVVLSKARTGSLEFQLVQMVVDNWRHQGGEIQVRSPVEIRNDIREILVGLEPSDLQYSLSIPVNWDTRGPHESDSSRLTERFVVLFRNDEGNNSAFLTRQDEMDISAVVCNTAVSQNELEFGSELRFDRRDEVNEFRAERLPARACFHFVE